MAVSGFLLEVPGGYPLVNVAMWRVGGSRCFLQGIGPVDEGPDFAIRNEVGNVLQLLSIGAHNSQAI